MASTIVKNRDRSALTRDQIARLAPSVLAEHAHESRSDRYLYVPTVQILDVLSSEGFEPVQVVESRSRDDSRRGFTRHEVRLARPGEQLRIVGDVKPEIVLTNSHDGSSAIALSAGLFRLVCSNGMIVSEGLSHAWKVRHSAKYADEIIEGTYRVVEDLNGPVAGQIEDLRARSLSHPERLLLAQTAQSLRWPNAAAPVEPEHLLRPRRAADAGNDAWHTLNVLQENTIRGGLFYRHQNDETRRAQSRHTRPVTGIAENQRINRGLWEAVTELTTGDRVDLAANVFERLSPEEREALRDRLTS